MSDVKPGTVNLIFKTSESLKKSGANYVKVSFEINEKVKLDSKFSIEHDGEEVWVITDKAAEKLIDKKDVLVTLKKKRFLRGPEIVE